MLYALTKATIDFFQTRIRNNLHRENGQKTIHQRNEKLVTKSTTSLRQSLLKTTQFTFFESSFLRKNKKQK